MRKAPRKNWDGITTEILDADKPVTSDQDPNAGGDAAVEAHVDAARAYAKRLAADKDSAPHGHVFVNGVHFALDDDILRSVQLAGAQMVQHVQEAVRALPLSFRVMLTR